MKKLDKLKADYPDEILDIDIIPQHGISCEKHHVNSQVFKVGIHKYDLFAGAKIDRGLLKDTLIIVIVCEECYESERERISLGNK